MMTLYVQNLAPRTTSDDVRVIFHQFGTVLDVGRVGQDGSGIPGRSVWVKMESSDEAQSALEALNGKDLNGSPMEIFPPR